MSLGCERYCVFFLYVWLRSVGSSQLEDLHRLAWGSGVRCQRRYNTFCLEGGSEWGTVRLGMLGLKCPTSLPVLPHHMNLDGWQKELDFECIMEVVASLLAKSQHR